MAKKERDLTHNEESEIIKCQWDGCDTIETVKLRCDLWSTIDHGHKNRFRRKSAC